MLFPLTSPPLPTYSFSLLFLSNPLFSFKLSLSSALYVFRSLTSLLFLNPHPSPMLIFPCFQTQIPSILLGTPNPPSQSSFPLQKPRLIKLSCPARLPIWLVANSRIYSTLIFVLLLLPPQTTPYDATSNRNCVKRCLSSQG